MYKTGRYRNKDKLNVHWKELDANATTKPTNANESRKSPIADNHHQSAIQERDKIAETNTDEATAAAAIEIARAAVEAAKLAMDAVHSSAGKYANWNTKHADLAAQPWCCIGDIMAFCDKYTFKAISRTDARLQQTILTEVKSLLSGAAPFSMRQRFPGNIRNPENLWICIGRCAGIEYHLKRILSTFRKPLEQLTSDKQRLERQNFHLCVNELRLDITARILELRLYDRNIFERDFQLNWEPE